MSTRTATNPRQRERIFMTGATLGAIPVRGDLLSLDVLRRESAHASIVIHLADAWANDFNMDYEEVLRIDAAVVDAIGDSLQGTSKRLVITSGTLAVNPDPTGAETTEISPLNPNPVNDRIRAEQHALSLCEKGVHVCAIRLAPYVYGRGGSGVRLFMQMSVTNGEVIYVNGGENRTSTVHVDDAARLYLLAAKKAKAGDIFNATSSTNIAARQMSEAMGAVLDLPVRSRTHEERASKFWEVLAKFLSAENRASSAKAIRELGWEPSETGIIEDIRTGSYQVVAEELCKSGAR